MSDIADLEEVQHMECDDSRLDGLDSRGDDLYAISKLQETQWYRDIMMKIDGVPQQPSAILDKGMLLDDDCPEYNLIADCNALLAEIEDEVALVHSFICDKYRLKFPELESLVQHPLDYARVVKVIGNEMDLTLVNLEGLLPSAIIMVVSVTASTTGGKPLPEDVLQKTIEACDRVLSLDSARRKVCDFVESRMLNFAPNLSAIVGTSVAAKLVGSVGGLSALARLPDSTVKCLGSKKKNLAGFSSATYRPHLGFLEQTEIYQSTPPSLRHNACRFVSAKSCLAARVDALMADPTGGTGRALREKIHKKLEHLQQRPPARLPKPLPVPHSECKKKRGGRRLRKMKERYAPTDVRRMANRMLFGVPEESSL